MGLFLSPTGLEAIMRTLNILTRAFALGALPLAAAAQQATTLSQVLDKIVAQEQVEMQSLRQSSPG